MAEKAPLWEQKCMQDGHYVEKERMEDPLKMIHSQDCAIAVKSKDDLALQNVTIVPKAGSWSRPGRGRNAVKCGIRQHPFFGLVPEGSALMVLSHRQGCVCPPCYDNLVKPCEHDVPPWDQPIVQEAPDCYVQPVMGDLNGWKFVTVGPEHKPGQELSDKVKKQINALLQRGLEFQIDPFKTTVKPNTFGAVGSDNELTKSDGFFLVEFQSNAYQLKKKAKVFGCNEEEEQSEGWMKEGTLLADAYFYHRINQAPNWYEHLERPRKKWKVWLQHLLDVGFLVEDYVHGDPHFGDLPGRANLAMHNQLKGGWVYTLNKFWSDTKEPFKRIKEQREKLELHEVDDPEEEDEEEALGDDVAVRDIMVDALDEIDEAIVQEEDEEYDPGEDQKDSNQD